jgi:hypothetical protein
MPNPADLMPYFPFVFVFMWLLTTTILAILAGWFCLMNRYPDRRDPAILTLRWQSGRMGLGVHMNGLLTFGACDSGLRVGMLRIFGIFCRDIFVPWDEISVTRKKGWLVGEQVTLAFGSTGRLTVLASVADRLASVAHQRWPEAAPPPPPAKKAILLRISWLWLLQTAFAASFFTLVPRLLDPRAQAVVPIPVAILFPGIVFAMVSLFRYWRETRQPPGTQK